MDTCKPLKDRIAVLAASLEQTPDELQRAAIVYEIARLQRRYDSCRALAAQFVVRLDGSLSMITNHPDYNTPATVDISLTLAFNASRTAVNAASLMISDPKGRGNSLLTERDVGTFERKSGRLVLRALDLQVDFRSVKSDLRGFMLSTDAENSLGKGSRMDKNGAVRLAGGGTFESGRWQTHTCELLVAGAVDPVP